LFSRLTFYDIEQTLMFMFTNAVYKYLLTDSFH